MLLSNDVEIDLIEKYPDLYFYEGDVLMYQNGKDNTKFAVLIAVFEA
jgi:hypothetical protein